MGIGKSWADVSPIRGFSLLGFVRAGQATLKYLFLTSSKYFQSVTAVGRRKSISQLSPIPER
jgi:hypothetical protein